MQAVQQPRVERRLLLAAHVQLKQPAQAAVEGLRRGGGGRVRRRVGVAAAAAPFAPPRAAAAAQRRGRLQRVRAGDARQQQGQRAVERDCAARQTEFWG